MDDTPHNATEKLFTTAALLRTPAVPRSRLNARGAFFLLIAWRANRFSSARLQFRDIQGYFEFWRVENLWTRSDEDGEGRRRRQNDFRSSCSPVRITKTILGGMFCMYEICPHVQMLTTISEQIRLLGPSARESADFKKEQMRSLDSWLIKRYSSPPCI